MHLFQFITISAVVFTGITLFLVAILTIVEMNVVKAGDCKIYINDDPNPVLVGAGASLLRTLSNTKIFLQDFKR